MDSSEDDSGYVIGRTPDSAVGNVHPSTGHIHQLWHIFSENVDPLTKVVHAPTIYPLIQKAASDIGSVPKNFEALMLAVYSTAVMSMQNDECERRFGETRKTLLSRYISATKAALAQVKFMGTTSIIVLQTLVLHTVSVRNVHEPRSLFTLSGIALRIAEAMGLHRDGTSLGLPPFETEIRRRIWWQLKMNDYRIAELAGLAKFRVIDTAVNPARAPANINDDELYPGMSSPPTESSGPTDMIFCVLRSEMGSLVTTFAVKFHSQQKGEFHWDEFVEHASKAEKRDKHDFIEEIKDLLETKHVRYCDPSQPLQLLTMLFARSAMDVARFYAHHPRRWRSAEQVSESERQNVWNISIRLLEQYDMVQTSPHLQRFAWHAAYFLQWHAFIHVLDSLRADPLMTEGDKAWHLVESIYKNHPEMMSNTRKTIYRAVGNLCLKAYSAREAALVNAGEAVRDAPEYIMTLRQQREKAKARINARNANEQQAQTLGNDARPVSVQASREPISGTTDWTCDTEGLNSLQEIPSLPPGPGQDAINNDAFWFDSSYANDLVGASDKMICENTDFMLAEDHMFDDTMIDWTQWDAWIGGPT